MHIRHDSLIHPPIEELLDRTDSKFALVTVASQRSRQINSYFGQLGEGLGVSVPPQVTSTSRKPLSIALEELAADKIAFRPRAEMEAEMADLAATAAAALGEYEPVDLDSEAPETDA